jgi:hypothetical protein
MTGFVASIRPSELDVPLYLHILGAMALVGVLLVAASSLLLAGRRDGGEATALARVGLWTLALGGVPAYLVMRIGAQWTASREGLDDVPEDPTWLSVGYITADAGALLLLVSLVLSVLGLRRLRSDTARPGGLPRAVGIIAVLLIAAYLVAIWAMTTKPD